MGRVWLARLGTLQVLVCIVTIKHYKVLLIERNRENLHENILHKLFINCSI